ncbi:redox-sensing transcriptional repressor Rex [Microaerobacter geothermalis]|uniref:redox-sensing transcriptional repressor Rex n=1 Tax=Microaerobacter geothermalis TaxID=674972 RepID=UPI001F398555|nr:redox-sensing transcriptional repressor Rex [Microaerobacter geothermalis]MCF6093345.1 redox-sensing transcriptional repressor Rex [Microaerobacter geothermalis]
MKTVNISEAVIRRLPIYLRFLVHLQNMGIKTVSSQELGQKLDINPAQIRKDLAYFGEFGRKGIGYEVQYLIEKIKQILKLDQIINVCLVGAGHLGHALSNYNVYQKDNMKIVAIFDADPQKIGTKIAGLTILPVEAIPETVKEKKIRVGIIAVPAPEAQKVAEILVEAGIEGILNFAPVSLRNTGKVRIHHADFTTELHSLAYYLE